MMTSITGEIQFGVKHQIYQITHLMYTFCNIMGGVYGFDSIQKIFRKHIGFLTDVILQTSPGSTVLGIQKLTS